MHLHPPVPKTLYLGVHGTGSSSQLQISEEQSREINRTLYARKLDLEAEIAKRFREGKPPLDVLPHPAHVQFNSPEIVFTGPSDAWGRSVWEFIKNTIHSYIEARNHLRTYLAEQHDEELRELLRKGLDFAEKMVRKYKRMVPKGWNWKERIYTVGGSEDEVTALINSPEFKLYFNV